MKILSPAGLQLCHYQVELLAPAQPFFHTAVQLSGTFGRISFTKIDIRNCTVWIAGYQISEPLTLQGFASELVFQLCYPVPPGTTTIAAGDAAAAQKIFLSLTGFHSISLPAACSQMLFIHYHPPYFTTASSANNGSLRSIFPASRETPPLSLSLNAAALTVLTQITNASPANRIVHLYLEAKVKELLTLLYQLANPESAPSLSEKEIATLKQVRETILADLSRYYTIFELAKLTGTNAYTLKSNFKTWFGIPLHLFLHNCRMEKATQLLLTSTLSVKEIAFTVGYKNVSNFSESFKNYFGYPPSRLREE